MKTYYYSIRENDKDWENQKQFSINAVDDSENSWIAFVNYCYAISYHFKSEIRACKSEGYNNQRYYFNADGLVLKLK